MNLPYPRRCLLCLYLLLPFAAAAQCLSPELALINSCIDHPNPNGSNTRVESELVILLSGVAPVPVAEIGLDLPFNGFGAENADLGVDLSGDPLGCPFGEPTVTALPGCANVIPLGPDDVIPPNSRVVIFTTSATVSGDLAEVDFSSICPQDQPVYVLQSACERSAGAFANGPPQQGSPLRTITVISACGLRGFTYNSQDLDPNEGTYYLVGQNTAGNLNCDLPVLPATCPVIDTSYYVCGSAGDIPIVTAQQLAAIYPQDVAAVSFHPTALDAELNDNRITEYQPPGTPSDTIYARIINSLNFCISIGELVIFYQPDAAVSQAPAMPVTACVNDENGTAIFNLRTADAEIGSGQPVTYFTDQAATEVIDNPENYASDPTTIYARAGILACTGNVVPVTLAVLPAPAFTCAVSQPVSNFGASDGAIQLDISAGQAPFQITYAGAAAGAVEASEAMVELPGLSAGTYALQLTDANGCTSDTCRVTLNTLLPLELVCEVRNNANGTTVLGSIGAAVSGGEPPFTVTLTDQNGGSTTVNESSAGETIFNNLTPGTYTVLVTDAAGQTMSCVQEIIQENCPLNVVDIRLLVTDCSGSDNTVISLDLAGFDGPVFTTWGGDANVSIFNGMNEAGPLPPGFYSAQVSDNSGCPPVFIDSIEVADRGLVMADLLTVTPSSACGQDGEVAIVAQSGGTPPYTVLLTDASGTPVGSQTASAGDTVLFSELAGTGSGVNNYSFTVTDQLGCATTEEEFSVGLLPEPSITLDQDQTMLTPPSCFGAVDGAISVSATGGAAPYDYVWTDFPGQAAGDTLAAQPMLTELPAGDYTLVVTEAGGCSETITLTLTEGTRPILNCGATTDALGTSAGTFTFSVSGDDIPLSVTVMTPDNQLLNYVNVAPGDTTVNLPGTGDFLAFATDANGCTSDTCNFTIAERGCALSVAASITPVGCTGEGQIVVSPAGGTMPYLFAWSEPAFPPSDTVRPGAPGTYALNLTDADGCALDTLLTIGETDDAPVLLNDSLRVLPSCSGDVVRLPVSFTGESPFSLSYEVDSAGVALPVVQSGLLNAVDTLVLPATWFAGPGGSITAMEVADAKCTAPLSLFTAYTLTRPDTVVRNDVTCRPEGVMIGGQLFTAQNPADTFLVTGDNPCGTLYEVALTFLTPETPDTVEVFLCPGESLEIPETGDVFNAGRPEGEVAYPRAGACDSLVYLRLDIPEVVLGSVSRSACEGDTIFLGDRFFTIDDPAGIARLAGAAANGCDSLVTVNVNFRRVGEVRLLGDHAICPGDSLELRFAYDGQGGINVQLMNLQGETLEINGVTNGFRYPITPEQSTTWSIIAATAGNCPGTFSGRSEITVNDLMLSTEVLTNPADFCNDTLGRAIVRITGGDGDYAVLWSNGPEEPLNPNLLAGTYRVTVTDGEGCSLQDTVLITDRPDLQADIIPLPPQCEGRSGSLQLDSIQGGVGPYLISLDGELFIPTDRVGDFRPPVGPGTAIVKDADGCLTELAFTVPGALRPALNSLTDTTIFAGDSVLLDPGFSLPVQSARWSPAASLSTPDSLRTFARPRSTTDYQLELLSSDGCAFSYGITVRVDERALVYAPTAFSPNGDGTNDVYQISFGSRVRELTGLRIHNRWGTLVYAGNAGWDGMLDGRPAPPAVYVFTATVTLLDGTERFVKGDFVLMH